MFCLHIPRAAALFTLMFLFACGEPKVPAMLQPTGLLQQHLVHNDDDSTLDTSHQVGALLIIRDDAHVIRCSAVLIGPAAVLTSAHCLTRWAESQETRQPERLYFTHNADVHHTLTKGTSAYIKRAYIHPQYKPQIPISADDSDTYFPDLKSTCGKTLFQTEGHQVERKAVADDIFSAEDAYVACAAKYFRSHDAQVEREMRRDPQYDLALAILDHSVETPSGVAKLPKNSVDYLEKDSPLLVVGYGRTNEIYDGTSFQHYPAGHRDIGWMGVLALTENQVVIDSASTATCSGDSGGGFFSRVNGNNTLVGITRASNSLEASGRCVNPSEMIRVAQFVPWIDSVLKRELLRH